MSHDEDYRRYLKAKGNCADGKCAAPRSRRQFVAPSSFMAKTGKLPPVSELMERYEIETGGKAMLNNGKPFLGEPLCSFFYVQWLETKYLKLEKEALELLEPVAGSKNDGTAIKVK